MIRSCTIRFVAVSLLLLIAGASSASAQSCSFTMPSFNFGAIDLAQNVNFDLTDDLIVNCTGNPGQTIRFCPNINAGSGGSASGGNPRYMLNGPNQLSYNIYRNSGFTQVWGSYNWNFSPPVGTVVLNSSGSGSATVPVRIRINAGQTGLPTGTYSSSFAGGQTSFAYSYPFFGIALCTIVTGVNAVQVPFSIQATNSGTCSVSATDLSFGSIGLISGNFDAMSTVSVTCSAGLTYHVGLNGGLTGASDPTQRKMTAGAHQITYGLYQDPVRTTPWGNTIGTNTAAGTGTGSVQALSVYGRIPQQTTPPVGTYSDTIVVTVTY